MHHQIRRIQQLNTKITRTSKVDIHSACVQPLEYSSTLGVGRRKDDDVIVLLEGRPVAEAANFKTRVTPLVPQHCRHAHVRVQLQVRQNTLLSKLLSVSCCSTAKASKEQPPKCGVPSRVCIMLQARRQQATWSSRLTVWHLYATSGLLTARTRVPSPAMVARFSAKRRVSFQKRCWSPSSAKMAPLDGSQNSPSSTSACE